MRLDKFLCESTELSRANAKKALHRGDVTCNGEIVKNPGFKVLEGCEVQLEGQLLTARGVRYIMLNKPQNTLCSTVDEVYPSVLNLLNIEKTETLRIAGRLDADTTGLVLITDDGQWSHKITSPNRSFSKTSPNKKECNKRYRVQLADPINESLIADFASGLQLRSEKNLTRPAQLEIITPQEVLLTISEGKYHQVKRMFATVGNKVTGLHREQIGLIALDADLKPGEWRYLTEQEILTI